MNVKSYIAVRTFPRLFHANLPAEKNNNKRTILNKDIKNEKKYQKAGVDVGD